MNNSNAYLYTEQSGITASPGELLMMLLNAEIKNIRIAILSIGAGKLTDAHQRLIKAQDIMDELILSLDDTYEISKELTPLYLFIKKELMSANIKKDTEKLEKLLPIVTELRDSWEKAYEISRKNTGLAGGI
jgi:flagellar biosynthetic protein FliS